MWFELDCERPGNVAGSDVPCVRWTSGSGISRAPERGECESLSTMRLPRRRVIGAIDGGQSVAEVAAMVALARHRRPRHGHQQPSPSLDSGSQSTPITAPSSLRGPSPIALASPGCFHRSGRLVIVFNHAAIESFWGRVQIELLNRQGGRPGPS